MMKQCDRAEELLSRRRFGPELSPREASYLEAHLAACDRCRRGAVVLGALAEPTAFDTPDLDDVARRRLDNAVMAAVGEPGATDVARPINWLAVLGGAAAAAVIGGIWLLSKGAVEVEEQEGSYGIVPLVSSADQTPLGHLTAHGKEVRLVDSAKQLAEEIKDILDVRNIAAGRKSQGSLKFYVSDEPEKFAQLGEKFLGRKIKIVKKAKN